MLSCSHDGTLRLWDADTGTQLKSGRVIGARLEDLNVSPDGRLALCTGQDCRPHLIDLERWREVEGAAGATVGADLFATTAGFSPDGRFGVSGGTDYAVRLWRMPAGTHHQK